MSFITGGVETALIDIDRSDVPNGHDHWTPQMRPNTPPTQIYLRSI